MFKGMTEYIGEFSRYGSQWDIWTSKKQDGWIAFGVKRQQPKPGERRNRFRGRYHRDEQRLGRNTDVVTMEERFPQLHRDVLQALRRHFDPMDW